MLFSAPLEVARTKACTLAPMPTSASVRWEPMKPSAPVTRQVRPLNASPNSRWSAAIDASVHWVSPAMMLMGAKTSLLSLTRCWHAAGPAVARADAERSGEIERVALAARVEADDPVESVALGLALIPDVDVEGDEERERRAERQHRVAGAADTPDDLGSPEQEQREEGGEEALREREAVRPEVAPDAVDQDERYAGRREGGQVDPPSAVPRDQERDAEHGEGGQRRPEEE